MSEMCFHDKIINKVRSSLLLEDYPINFMNHNINEHLNKIYYNIRDNSTNFNFRNLHKKLISPILLHSEFYNRSKQVMKKYEITAALIVNNPFSNVIKLEKDMSEDFLYKLPKNLHRTNKKIPQR